MVNMFGTVMEMSSMNVVDTLVTVVGGGLKMVGKVVGMRIVDSSVNDTVCIKVVGMIDVNDNVITGPTMLVTKMVVMGSGIISSTAHNTPLIIPQLSGFVSKKTVPLEAT